MRLLSARAPIASIATAARNSSRKRPPQEADLLAPPPRTRTAGPIARRIRHCRRLAGIGAAVRVLDLPVFERDLLAALRVTR